MILIDRPRRSEKSLRDLSSSAESMSSCRPKEKEKLMNSKKPRNNGKLQKNEELRRSEEHSKSGENRSGRL